MPWSVPLGLLDAEIAKRGRLNTLRVFSAHVYGERLDREGSRTEAIDFFARTAELLRDNPFGVYLQIDLAELLRDEHEIAEAMLELDAARERIAELRESGGGTPPESYLDYYDALAMAELGAATEQLGMVDVAEPLLEASLELAERLEYGWGPATWGGALVYLLNLALDHRLSDGAGLRKRYTEYPFRDDIPPETAAQIELRLARIDVQRAFLGEIPAGSGRTELLEVLDTGLKVDERMKARLYLATSYLDGDSPEHALPELDDVRADLERHTGQEPAILFEVGVRARYLRSRSAPAEERARFFEGDLKPAIREQLALMRRWPLEDAGVAPLALDQIQGAFEQLIAYELDLDAEHGPERALAWLVELQAAGTFARGAGIEAPSLAAIRASLLRGAPDASGATAILAWVPGRETTHLFALTADAIEVHRLVGTMSLQQAAKRLEESLLSALYSNDARSDERLTAAIDAASRAFLPDELAARLDAAVALRPIGLEAFGYVPLEALPAPRERAAGWSGAGGERWKRVLGCTHVVTYLPSLPVGVWLARRAAAALPTSGDAVVFVARGEREGYPELVLGPSDIGLAALGASAVGARAPDELDSALGGAKLAYLFCHGLYDAQRLRPAGLLVDPRADPGAWFAEEIEERAWPPVVLVSACGSARAPLRRGDDGAGKLLAAFYRGGSSVAATSTMPLEESAAAELGRLVSADLGRGRSVDEAFLSARRGARPEAFGVHPVHAQLWHVWGAGDLRIDSGSLGAERNETSASRLAGLLALGALLALAALIILGARRRRARARS